MRSRTQALVVLVTCANVAEAKRLAAQLVRARLAACVNLVPKVESFFRWKGKLERTPETILLIKTTKAAFEPLRRAVLRLHSYDTPEIIAVPIARGHPPYLAWVLASTEP